MRRLADEQVGCFWYGKRDLISVKRDLADEQVSCFLYGSERLFFSLQVISGFFATLLSCPGQFFAFFFCNLGVMPWSVFRFFFLPSCGVLVFWSAFFSFLFCSFSHFFLLPPPLYFYLIPVPCSSRLSRAVLFYLCLLLLFIAFFGHPMPATPHTCF